MVDEVRREIERIREYISNERLSQFDEANTKATAIEPILRALGWDVADPDEVRREFSVRARPNARPVDYLLFCDDTPNVIVEAKRGNQSLERHQEQLQDYVGFALSDNVQIAVLTNGAAWWYYLPIRAASWERRRVATVELSQQDSRDVAQTLVNLLGKENVKSGRAIQNAERHQISDTLPKIWNQLIAQTDSSIVNLLIEQIHGLCVREPDRNEVEQFLSGHLEQIQITPLPSTPDSVPPVEPHPSPEPSPSGSVTGKKPVAFIFNGSRYEVTSWRAMLIRLCEIVYSAHRNRFEDVLSLKGKTKPPFSRNAGGMASPVQINSTGIFVETHGAAQALVKRATRLITRFGYGENDLLFETQTP